MAHPMEIGDLWREESSRSPPAEAGSRFVSEGSAGTGALPDIDLRSPDFPLSMTLDGPPRNSCSRENPFRRFTAAAESAILRRDRSRTWLQRSAIGVRFRSRGCCQVGRGPRRAEADAEIRAARQEPRPPARRSAPRDYSRRLSFRTVDIARAGTRRVTPCNSRKNRNG